MSDSLFSQIRSRGEEFFTEVSNNLMSNPAFIEVLKKGVAAKEEVDKRVAEALKTMNLASRKEIAKLENRVLALEAEVADLKGTSRSRASSRRKKK